MSHPLALFWIMLRAALLRPPVREIFRCSPGSPVARLGNRPSVRESLAIGQIQSRADRALGDQLRLFSWWVARAAVTLVAIALPPLLVFGAGPWFVPPLGHPPPPLRDLSAGWV